MPSAPRITRRAANPSTAPVAAVTALQSTRLATTTRGRDH
ncbi:MAG: hypothetical protein RLZZ221_2938, partial [Verrucomicrobiota bacterium]